MQSVRDESSRVQWSTSEMQEVSQLLPNKIWKQLDQYSNWKIISTKTSAGFSSKNQLNWEYNLRINWFPNVRNEWSRIQVVTIDMQENSQLLPNKFWKQLNQYSKWKIIETKTLAGFSLKNQLKRNITWDSTKFRVLEMNQVESSDPQVKCRKFLSYFRTSFENNWTSIATGKT